jgi:ABC-2 type transport system ATP-binding protein
LGLAPQDVGVYPLTSVRENLAFFGELFGLRGRALRRRVEEVAEALALSPLLDREAGSLSGGERRRVHTAMALIHRPPLLLLDEPTEGADVKSRREILELVRSLAQEGSAVLYSTHRMDEVECLDAGVAILDAGRLVAHGSVGDLVSCRAQLIVEIALDGPTPATLADYVARDGLLRIPTTDAASTIAHALSAVGRDSTRLHSIEIIRPRLESVYLQLTGRRYGDEEPTTG